MKARGWGRAVACTQLLYGNLYGTKPYGYAGFI